MHFMMSRMLAVSCARVKRLLLALLAYCAPTARFCPVRPKAVCRKSAKMPSFQIIGSEMDPPTFQCVPYPVRIPITRERPPAVQTSTYRIVQAIGAGGTSPASSKSIEGNTP